MKPEDPNLDTSIEPELEARLVAQMLGEASEFEQAELERLIKEKPEMAILQRRLEAVHGLVSEATTQGPDDDWKLPDDRREQLLDTMRNGNAPNPTIRTLVPANKSRRLTWFLRSACAAAIFMLCAVLTTPVMQRARV